MGFLAIASPRGAAALATLVAVSLALSALVRNAARAVGVPGPGGALATTVVVTGVLASVLTLAAGIIALGLWLLVSLLQVGRWIGIS